MLLSFARRAVVLAIVGFMVFAGGVAIAHEQRAVGNVTMRVGWLNEPTYSGSVNAVQVFLANKGGGAITDAKLTTVVLFGGKSSATKSQSITLDPSDEKPGEYDGAFVPTRPGTYTFHITGTAGGQNIDQFFTSSSTTFDNVKDPTVDEFPAKDPTAGQLSERLTRIEHGASTAKKIAALAFVVGAIGVVIGLAALLRKRG
jgi:hypothetical protein